MRNRGAISMWISEFTRYFVPLGNEVCPQRGLKKVENTEAVFWARFENILDSACPHVGKQSGGGPVGPSSRFK